MEKRICKICSNEKFENKWIPVSIESLVSVLSRKIDDYPLKKNIAYNLQYLEYIDECFQQLYLTNVILTQNYKIFIIIACSIIEAILFYEIKKSGNEKRSIWNLIKKIKSNEAKIFENKTYKLETFVYEKLNEEKKEEMRFQQILNISQSKKLLKCDESIFENIKELKNLRNKLHLQSIEFDRDTDWNNFSSEKYILGRKTLLEILKMYFNLSQFEIDNKFKYLIRKK